MIFICPMCLDIETVTPPPLTPHSSIILFFQRPFVHLCFVVVHISFSFNQYSCLHQQCNGLRFIMFIIIYITWMEYTTDSYGQFDFVRKKARGCYCNEHGRLEPKSIDNILRLLYIIYYLSGFNLELLYNNICIKLHAQQRRRPSHSLWWYCHFLVWAYEAAFLQPLSFSFTSYLKYSKMNFNQIFLQ